MTFQVIQTNIIKMYSSHVRYKQFKHKKQTFLGLNNNRT